MATREQIKVVTNDKAMNSLFLLIQLSFLIDRVDSECRWEEEEYPIVCSGITSASDLEKNLETNSDR